MLNESLQNELDEVLEYETKLEEQRQHHLREIHEEKEKKRLERIYQLERAHAKFSLDQIYTAQEQLMVNEMNKLSGTLPKPQSSL